MQLSIKTYHSANMIKGFESHYPNARRRHLSIKINLLSKKCKSINIQSSIISILSKRNFRIYKLKTFNSNCTIKLIFMKVKL